jgi:long-chain acyl-CoA synthetase
MSQQPLTNHANPMNTPDLLQGLPERLHETIAPWVATQPDALAVEDDLTTLSYAQFDAATLAAAQQLSVLGVRPGDRVIFVAENCVALAVLFFAMSRLDAWACVVNARLSSAEIEAIREHSQARRVIYLHRLSPAAAAHAELAGAQELEFDTIGSVRVGELNAQCSPEPVDAAGADQVAALIYTSGTTGKPKGVMLTHRNLIFVGDTYRRNRMQTPADKAYAILPMSHVYGLSSVLIGMLVSGGALLLECRFDPARVADAWARRGVTVMHGVSAMYAKLLEWSRQTGTPLHAPQLRIAQGGGGPLSQSLKDDFEQTTGVVLHLGYGMTETSPTIAQTRLDKPSRDVSSGLPIPGVELRRVDAEGNDVGADEVGEVLVRGPNVMKGYYRDPEQTAATLSADLGRQDAEGNLTIVGRAKELIIRSGFNVYPVEVESAINAHPAVLQSAVVGREVADNEEVVAFLEARENAVLTPQDLETWLRKRLSPYKIPTEIVILDHLPAAATGKILKTELKRMAATRNQA